MPLSRTSSRPGGMTLKNSFGSSFMQRKLYAKQRQGVRVTHTKFQERVTRCRNAKCPLNLSNRIREAGKSVLT
jgi:hypothetical protein